MAKFSPKIDIINHFDNLINTVDIDIDSCLEKYNYEQVLGELLTNSENNRKNFRNKYDDFNVEFSATFNSSKHQSLNLWTESTKVIDYLKQVRMKTIEELRKAQEDTLKYYMLNSSHFDELRSELFAKKFYFQVNFTQSEKRYWAFDIFTFATDFYMSPSDIDSLEKLINAEEEPFGRDAVFDDKMVLIGLLYKYFIVNLLNVPNHVIRVCKEDVLNIEKITFGHEYSGANLTSSSTIDLSKLVDLYLEDKRESININIEGLSSLESLHLGTNSTELYLSIRNLCSLKSLSLLVTCTIDENIVSIFDQVQNIEQLYLDGNFSYFNLDNLVNLKKLILIGTVEENFNMELFKNVCNQLEYIYISLNEIDDKFFFKLFDGHIFPYLEIFCMSRFNIKRLKIEFINRFPMLRQLFILDCKLEEIEQDAFSNSQKLSCLDLSQNRLKFIEKNTFSNLSNLQTLDLSKNELNNLDKEFIGVRNLVEFSLENDNFKTFHRYWLKLK